MPSNISKARLHKAFNEGRRSVASTAAQNPYDNPKLRELWEKGHQMQRAGELKTPIPPMEQGETRATRAPRNPPGTKRVTRVARDAGGRRDARGSRGRRWR